MGTDVKGFSKCRMRIFRPLSPSEARTVGKQMVPKMKMPFGVFRRTENSYEAKKCFIRSVGGRLGGRKESISIYLIFVRRIFKKTPKNRDFSLFGPKNELILLTIFSSPQRTDGFKSSRKTSHPHFHPLQVGRF